MQSKRTALPLSVWLGATPARWGPLMGRFTTTLRSRTQGRGSFSFAFERYEQLPANLEEKVIAQAKELGLLQGSSEG